MHFMIYYSNLHSVYLNVSNSCFLFLWYYGKLQDTIITVKVIWIVFPVIMGWISKSFQINATGILCYQINEYHYSIYIIVNSTVMNCFYIFLLLLLKVDKSSCKLYGCKNVSISYIFMQSVKKNLGPESKFSSSEFKS